MYKNIKSYLLKNKINLVSFFILNLILLPVISFAQLNDPLGGTDIKVFISKVLSYVVKVGSVIATFAFVYTGYLFAFAKGNSGQLDNAKSALLNTIIGVTILLGAELIGNMITNTVGSIK